MRADEPLQHLEFGSTTAKDARDAAVKSAARVLEIFELFCECRMG